jgi:hypothetical protein
MQRKGAPTEPLFLSSEMSLAEHDKYPAAVR